MTRRAVIMLGTMLALACHADDGAQQASRELEHTAEAPGRHATTIDVDGAELSVSVLEGTLALTEDEISTWVRRSAHAVATYYGRFPVARARIEIEAIAGAEVGNGRTTARRMPLIKVKLGRSARASALDDDWVLVHEMVHLATPSLPAEHLWFEEGVASYVEPIARVQSNVKRADDVLLEWVRGMPQGEPQRDDQGLDRTHTWGRTYWGGALFCLLADVTIRERTSNRFGLQDALRTVLANLGDNTHDRSIDEVIATGDAAVGVPVLRELYDAHARSALPVDLPALWRKLGIRVRGRNVELDDSAPLASVRKAVFAAPAVPARR